MIEQAVITKILETGDMKTPDQIGISDECFADPNYRLLYKDICDYYYKGKTAGNVPTKDWVEERYPFEYESVQQDLAALCSELLEQHIKTSLIETCVETMERANTSPTEAIYTLREKLISLEGQTAETDELVFTESINYLKERYSIAKENKGVTGVPYPWKTLTKVSSGMNPGELILFYGRPKQLKTWVALSICANAYLNHDKRVLIFAWEQGPKELMIRVAALFAKVDYELWKTGSLSPEEESRAWDVLETIIALEEAKEGRKDRPLISIMSSVDQRLGTGVTMIRNKIEEAKPDLVLVDGLYNMTDDREKKKSLKWTNQGSIINDLKGTAQQYKIPILATTQANRLGEDPSRRGTSDVAFTDGAGMWADALIKIMKKKKGGDLFLILDVRAAREFDMDGITLRAKPALYFEEDKTLTSEEDVLKELGVDDSSIIQDDWAT